MSFYPREHQILVIDLGSFCIKIGGCDYTQPPKLLVASGSLDLGVIRPLLKKSFAKLQISLVANSAPLLVILPAESLRDDVQKLTQFVFEELNAPSLYLLPQPLAILHACGASSGNFTV